MRVVITGASGNVGTALLSAAAGPDRELLALARRRPPRDTAPYAGARWIECDIGGPAAQPVLDQAFAGADAVVHLAWAVNPRVADPPMRRTNRVGTEQVLAAAARGRVPHLVVASSVAAYTPAPRWSRVDEYWPRSGVPGSAYSRDKAELETMLDAFARAHPETVLARIRPCGIAQGAAAAEFDDWLLGPWFPHTLVGRPWLPVPLWGDLRLQLVHAHDVAAALDTILSERAVGAFDLAAEPVLTARQLADASGGFRLPVPHRALSVAATAAWRTGVHPMHPGWLNLADRASLVSARRARRELRWVPRYSAFEVLNELISALRRGGRGTGPVLAPEPLPRGLGRPTHQSQLA